MKANKSNINVTNKNKFKSSKYTLKSILVTICIKP